MNLAYVQPKYTNGNIIIIIMLILLLSLSLSLLIVDTTAAPALYIVGQ